MTSVTLDPFKLFNTTQLTTLLSNVPIFANECMRFQFCWWNVQAGVVEPIFASDALNHQIALIFANLTAVTKLVSVVVLIVHVFFVTVQLWREGALCEWSLLEGFVATIAAKVSFCVE